MIKILFMQKKIRFTMWMAFYVVCLCVIGMMMTFVNDWIQASGFFGDIRVMPHKEKIWNEWEIVTTDRGSDFGVDVNYYWGARHYWYYWMCVLLFLLSILRIIFWAVNYFEKPEAVNH